MVRFVEFVHLHLEIYFTITFVKANREKVLNTNFTIYYCKIVLINLNNINFEFIASYYTVSGLECVRQEFVESYQRYSRRFRRSIIMLVRLL